MYTYYLINKIIFVLIYDGYNILLRCESTCYYLFILLIDLEILNFSFDDEDHLILHINFGSGTRLFMYY